MTATDAQVRIAMRERKKGKSQGQVKSDANLLLHLLHRIDKVVGVLERFGILGGAIRFKFVVGVYLKLEGLKLVVKLITLFAKLLV